MADKDRTPEPAQPEEKHPAKTPNQDDAVTTPIAPAPAAEPDVEDPFDFGGLPKRNLKKNLGCGG